MKLDDLVTITEAAELVGCSRQNIHLWIKNGVLGSVQMGNQKLIRKDALLTVSEMMSERKKGGRPRRGKKK